MYDELVLLPGTAKEKEESPRTAERTGEVHFCGRLGSGHRWWTSCSVADHTGNFLWFSPPPCCNYIVCFSSQSFTGHTTLYLYCLIENFEIPIVSLKIPVPVVPSVCKSMMVCLTVMCNFNCFVCLFFFSSVK